MSSSTLVQYLPHTGKSVTTGADVQLGVSPSSRQVIETFRCETTITVGDLVALDVTKMATDTSGGYTCVNVITADFNSATVQKCVIGVAKRTVAGTATSPKDIDVIVRGPAPLVNFVGATAIGDPMILDPAGAAGKADLNVAAGIQPVVGWALTLTGGAGTGTIFVNRNW